MKLTNKPAVLFVEIAGLLGERRVSQAHASAGLVHQIDGLVREEAVANELVRELGGRLERLVGVGELVVDLVALAQTLQDVDAVVHTGLGHHHRLEAALQRGVLCRGGA
eukprot:8412487-Pyramimonas_sp.AAC.1